MSPMPGTVSLRTWFGLIAISLCGQAWAAPEYVTAWPKQVAVEKPDPILGNKPLWESWIYSEAFAKSFKGFTIEKADPELKGGIKAMALRIFMRNFWQELNPHYPEQYACEIDVYFDSTISLPSSESGNPKKVFPAYLRGINAGYRRLEPYGENDKAAIRTSQPVRFSLKAQPLLFADQPLDGRYSSFGVREYRPSLIPGMSVITLLSGLECAITAPLKKGGGHWLSLLGERPWDRTEGGPPKAMRGQYDRNISLAFEAGQSPESRGYLRVPAAFNKVALPKATLIKVLNWCIHKKHAHLHPVGKQMPEENWKLIAHRCAVAEQQGEILPDPLYHLVKRVCRKQVTKLLE